MKTAVYPGHVTESPVSLGVDLAALAGEVASIFVSEVADPDRAAALPLPGFTVNHTPGVGKGECALLTKDSRYKVLSKHLFKLTDGGGKRRLAHPIYAPFDVLESVATGHVIVYGGPHFPAHLETIWRLIPLPARTKARLLMRRSDVVGTYVKALTSLRSQVMHLAAEVHADDIVIPADWNMTPSKWFEHFVESVWPGLQVRASKAPDLGKRTVGWILTTMRKTKAEVHEAKGSDHRIGIYTLEHLNKVPIKHDKPAKPPPPFDIVTYNGVRMDNYLKVAIQTLEAGRLKDLAPLTVFQGDWHTGVAASAGTHDRSGVVDFAPFAFGRKIKAWRDLFGPAWHRPTIPGLWSEHIHCVIESCPELAPLAATQVTQYHQGLDGLADHARDPNQHHPRVTFDYAAAWHEING